MGQIPDGIAPDVWAGATSEAGQYLEWLLPTPSDTDAEYVLAQTVARAIMAEREACAKRAGNYLMLKTPLDVPRIVACEAVIRCEP